MFKNMKASTKVFLMTAPLALVNIAVLIYQFVHLVISPWNIIPTLLLIFILVGNIINMLGIKLPGRLASLSQFGAPAPSDAEQNAYRENEDFYAINTSFPTKLTVKNIIWKTLFLAIFIGLTCLFSVLGANIQYDQVVTGTIIEKRVEGEVYTEYTDDGTTTHDNRVLVMTVSYTVGEDIYRTEVRDNFSHSRDNNFIKLCVNNDGTYVCPYDKVQSFRIMRYASIVFAIITFLGFVFKLPNQYLALLVIGVVGVGIICLFNSADWGSWLLKDFTLFGGCFVTLCTMSIIQLILLRIMHSIGIRRDGNFKLS